MSHRLRTAFLLCLTGLLLSNCGDHGAADLCGAFVPVYVSATEDTLSDATAKPVLSNNLSGEKFCGWEPTK